MYHDDGYGVGEPLNETGITGKGLVARGKAAISSSDDVIVAGKQYLQLSEVSKAARRHRLMAEQLYMSPMLTFASMAELVRERR